MSKKAGLEFRTQSWVSNRWSPRAFSERSIDPTTLGALFEAVRWSASAFNEQPWRFIVARKEESEAFARLLDCLVPNNQSWAKDAAALAVTFASERYARNDRENAHAWHDVGLAMGQLALEATARGLSLHQMAGIDREKIAGNFTIPKGFAAVSGVAIGYRGDPSGLPQGLAEREAAPRARRPQSQTVFFGDWGQPYDYAAASGYGEIIEFWFGKLDDDGLASDEQRKVWWKKDAAFDAEVQSRFSGLRADALEGRLDTWQESARGNLAQIILTDQLSRNMFRGSPRMYEADEFAVRATRRAVELGYDLAVHPDERVFTYMPLMHSEALEDQELCITLMQQLVDSIPEGVEHSLGANVKYAVQHRDIVAEFGRFPHRNEILGRASTAEETAFLQKPGSSF